MKSRPSPLPSASRISVCTENSDGKTWLFFDDACPACRDLVRRHQTRFRQRGFHPLPQQTPWVRALLNLKPHQAPVELKVLTADGTLLGGIRAVLNLARAFPWLRPLLPLARIPGIFHLLDISYRWVARHRYCLGGACPLQEDS